TDAHTIRLQVVVDAREQGPVLRGVCAFVSARVPRAPGVIAAARHAEPAAEPRDAVRAALGVDESEGVRLREAQNRMAFFGGRAPLAGARASSRAPGAARSRAPARRAPPSATARSVPSRTFLRHF